MLPVSVKDRIAEIVATASHDFEDAVGIRLELVDCQPWNYQAVRRGDTWTTAHKGPRLEAVAIV